MNELKELLQAHLRDHPAAEVGDAVKFLYQNEFGGGHLIIQPEKVLNWLREEMAECKPTDEPLFEPIGNGLVRVNLYPAAGRISPETLFSMFVLSAQKIRGDMGRFKEKLALVYDLGFDRETVDAYLTGYAAAGYPAVSHSEAYRAAYVPAYRVIREEYARYFEAFSAIDRFSRFVGPVIVGIDGMCGSGKTTLAGLLAEVYDANLFHADDYYLPPEKRTPERFAAPGANMERERLAAEVLVPLTRGESVTARKYDCDADVLEPPVAYPGKRVNIIEGSYSLHPELRDFYTLKIAVRTDPATQLARIGGRDPEQIEDFREKWIPLENDYFGTMGVFESADLIIET